MAKGKHYLEMDGLRGIAALSVAFFHQQKYLGGEAFFGHGYLAVDFFYMLSGFVLAHAYGDRLKQQGSMMPFIRDRLIRLHPMLIVGALLGVLASLIDRDIASRLSPVGLAGATLVSAMGLPAFWYGNPFWINPPAWSLFFELTVNLLFALTAFAFSPRRQWLFAGSTVAVMLALDYHYGFFGFGWTQRALGLGLVRVCASFTIGVILHRIHCGGVLANGGKRWWIAPVLVMSFALLPTHSKVSMIYDPIVVFGLYPLLILASAGSKEIIPRIAVLSGALSYPFYLVHVSILEMLQYGVTSIGYPVNTPVALANLLAAIGVSWLILKFYDEPVRSHLRKRFGSKLHRSTATTP